MEKISDYGAYTDGMRKSMTDKTWFLNMILRGICFIIGTMDQARTI